MKHPSARPGPGDFLPPRVPRLRHLMCRVGARSPGLSSPAHRAAMVERRVIVVRGIVQGVGFRPFVYNLASRLRLGGFVKNQTGSLLIEVEGDVPSLDCFLAELAGKPPPLAQIE